MTSRTLLIFGLVLGFVATSLGQKKYDGSIHSQNSSKKLISNFKITLSDSWFSRDKAHHFFTSAFLSSTGYYFLYEEQHLSNRKSRHGAVGISLSLGLVKEIRDGFKPENAFSIKDLTADVLGSLLGIVIISDL